MLETFEFEVEHYLEEDQRGAFETKIKEMRRRFGVL